MLFCLFLKANTKKTALYREGVLCAFQSGDRCRTDRRGLCRIQDPTKFDELELVYSPYKYYNNDTVILPIAESDITHYKNPFGPSSD